MAKFPQIEVTKEEAAEKQLCTAIKVFLEGKDFISPYTLASAADGITEGIYKNRRSEILLRQLSKLGGAEKLQFSWSEEIQILIKDEHHNEAFNLLNCPRNFFKHADKDADSTLEFGGVEQTASIIFIAC